MGDEHEGDRFRRVAEVFRRARARRPEERGPFLDAACAGDAAFRAQVESLLGIDQELPTDATDEQLARRATRMDDETPSSAVALDAMAGSASPREPRRIGQYSVRRAIASGGMGTVYEAVQEQPRRRVAIKVMRSGVASKSALRRFEFESQILARLRHPNIAQVYEAGTHDEGEGGVPYFAMEYIPNPRSLTEYAVQQQLSTRERLELFCEVCDAVHHGHQKGIIHRDLKPGNILVDSHGKPKIIDFGVARATDSDMAVTTLQTDVGQLIGTLQYMSPEQCEADPADLDTRSDVYALGVLLYELLCDQLPYDLSPLGMLEAARVIREQPPARPSTINRTLRGDVETITLKAIEKDREQRYRSAADIGDDIRRYLNEEPILARPPSIAYQLRLFARRHRGMVTGLAGGTGVLVLAAAVSFVFGVQAEQARRAAVAARETADARAGELQVALARSDRQAYLANIAAAQQHIDFADMTSARRRLAGASPDLRRWEWSLLINQIDRSLLVLDERSRVINHVEFLPESDLVATGSFDSLRIWNGATGDEITTVEGGLVSISPDGARLAVAHEDGAIHLRDSLSGASLGRLRARAEAPASLSFSPDGDRLLGRWPDQREVGDRTSTYVIWDLRSRELVATERGSALAFAPDGSHIAVAGIETVRVLHLASADEIATCPTVESEVSVMRFSPDGSRLGWLSGSRPLSAGTHWTFTLWHPADGSLTTVASDEAGSPQRFTFSPDGERVALQVGPSTVRLLDAATGAVRGSLANRQSIKRLEFLDDDGAWLLTGSTQTLAIWDASTAERLTRLSLENGLQIDAMVLSPDGTRLATSSWDHVIRIWNLPTGHVAATLRGHVKPVRAMAFSGDGDRLASGSWYGTTRIWDPRSIDEIRSSAGHAQRTRSLVYAPSGRLVCGSWEVVRLLDLPGQERTLSGHEGWVHTVAASSDGRFVASGSWDATIRVWDAWSGLHLRTLEGHASEIHSVSFSPDGDRIASGSRDRNVAIWDAETGRRLLTLSGHRDDVTSVAYAPDGSLIASASRDRTIRIWDAATGAPVASWPAHEAEVLSVAFAPDVPRLASASRDKTVRIWDIPNGEPVSSLVGHAGSVNVVAYALDGSRLMSGADDATIKIWDPATGEEVITLRGHEAAVRCLAFSPGGSVLASGATDGSVRLWDATRKPGHDASAAPR